MTGQNHYEVLGVPPDADLSAIRAAYVSLLKVHHPDQAGVSDPQENGTQVQRIIAAYRSLKDPVTRARYDAALRREARPALPPTTNPAPGRRVRRAKSRATSPPKSTPPPVRQIRRPRLRFRLHPDTIFYVGVLVLAAAGLHLLLSRLIKEPRPIDKVLAGTSSVREMSERMQLEEIVRKAGMMSRAEASKYSSRCFAAARRSRNAAVADPCVGFDMAYVYWRDTVGGPLVADPYFQQAAMDSRFRNAFGRLNPTGAAARVQSVRAATLRAIMQTPRPMDEFELVFPGNQAGSHTARVQKENSGALPKD